MTVDEAYQTLANVAQASASQAAVTGSAIATSTGVLVDELKRQHKEILELSKAQLLPPEEKPQSEPAVKEKEQ